MNEGQIVEYIDDQKILCAAVLEQKKNRIRVLNENNREVNLSEKRISYVNSTVVSLKNSRDHIARTLKEKGAKRQDLSALIDIQELWEVLNTESEWLDIDTIAELSFEEEPGCDEKSAVLRAMFHDKLYFKFNHDKFFPFSEKQVNQLIAKREEQERKKRLIEVGGEWLKNNISLSNPENPPEEIPVVKIISSYYLHENESQDYEIAREIFKVAGIEPGLKVFKFLVRLGIWDVHENTDLLKYEIESKFSNKINDIVKDFNPESLDLDLSKRRDLRGQKIFTIDGASTRDFDDAISFEVRDGKKWAGVHIIDVAHYVDKDTPLDRNARTRGSSIYMPDKKIPMLHPYFSENNASLVEGNDRPAISIYMEVSSDNSVESYEIVPSLINVTDQITYEKADELIKNKEDEDLVSLHLVSEKLREERFAAHAVHISIPDVDVHVNKDNEIDIKVLDRETTSWQLVSEFMIKANSLMADFLKTNEIPAVFRGQGKPENRLYEGDKGTLLQQLLQRKEMSRVIISTTPEPHCGLGANAYLTATSPIRKYYDLVCQRQIRSHFGFNEAYSEEEISEITAMLENTLTGINRVQFSRKRYWMLKALEEKRGEKEPALVINEKRNNYGIFLLNYMMESRLTRSPGMKLKPGDNIQVTIQNVNARSDILSVHLS